MHIRPSKNEQAALVVHGKWERDSILRAFFRDDFERYLEGVTTILDEGLRELQNRQNFTA